ncbi:MAG: transglycosylase SLT domain-containing protein [Gemmatimonas sp.]
MTPASSFRPGTVFRVAPRSMVVGVGALLLVSACRGGGAAPVTVAAPLAVPSGAALPSAPARPVASPTTRDEVVRTAVAVFGDSAAVAVADSPNAAPVWDIDVRSYETHDRVAHYVDLFSTRARERFVSRLSRGTRYEPMIRAKLRASGMPEDLTYLALIESGYDPHAYSRAAAVGIWQFMSSTARAVGLRVDWWMDERRDPARATDGAIRFLDVLQKQFGSFYLAAAAYNGGPGRVSRGLTRFADELEGAEGEDRFFALAEQDYLRAETKNYVPQLIAAALVAKRPETYGLAIDTLPLYVYDSVKVAPGTSLAAVAQAGDLVSAALRDLNPALLRGIAPPDAAIFIRVPVGAGERIRIVLDSLGAERTRGYRIASVAESVTPTAFAKAQGVSLKQLRWFNPAWKTTRKGRLVAGQALRVPADLALAYARDIPDPSLEKYGGRGGTTTLTARGVHVVKRGETLGAIARRYGLSETRLKSMNGLRGSRILAGQALQVRGAAAPAGMPSKAARSKSGSTRAVPSSASKAKASKAQKSTPKTSKPKPPRAKASRAKPSKTTRG